jgi:peptidyl-tRNA hydrolase, PTH1 family
MAVGKSWHGTMHAQLPGHLRPISDTETGGLGEKQEWFRQPFDIGRPRVVAARAAAQTLPLVPSLRALPRRDRARSAWNAPSERAGDRVKIVVGLGNPGGQYEKTRHNIGWMVLDRIADRAGWTGKGRTRDAAAVAMGRYKGLDLTIVKPLTFMNESGLAVRKVLAREHAPLNDLLVVADDFALPFGKLRFREGGGPGGHNGLGSIIDELSTEKINRLRVGIGAPERGFVDHVLAPFEPDERERLDALLDAAADAVEEWARHGTSKAANRFNMFELRPADESRVAAPGAVDGPPAENGVRRTKTGWRKVLKRGDDA